MKRQHAFIVSALLALALTACGGSSSGDGTTGTQAAASSGTATTRSGRPAFFSDEVRSCLRKQGVDVPERPQGGDGQPPQGGGLPGAAPPDGAAPRDGGQGGPGQLSDADREKLRAAMKACGVEMPQGGARRPEVSDAAYQQRVKAYVACVREHGFDLPDPNFSGDGPIFDPDEVDQDDKAFQTASARCQDKLRPATATTSTTS